MLVGNAPGLHAPVTSFCIKSLQSPQRVASSAGKKLTAFVLSFIASSLHVLGLRIINKIID